MQIVTNNPTHTGSIPWETIPLVVVITGHRDIDMSGIEAEKKLRDSINEVFTIISDCYPNTDLALVSPLAEGADQLVASAAMEWREKRNEKQSTVRLIVPQPYDSAEYRAEFKTDKAKDEFDRLLSSEPNPLIFTLPLAKGNSIDRTDYRENQKKALANYLADCAHIVISLWDGDTSNKCHSHQLMQQQLKGSGNEETLPLSSLVPGDVGPVFNIAAHSGEYKTINQNDLYKLTIIVPGNRPDPVEKQNLIVRFLEELQSFFRFGADPPEVVASETADEQWICEAPKEFNTSRFHGTYNRLDSFNLDWKTLKVKLGKASADTDKNIKCKDIDATEIKAVNFNAKEIKDKLDIIKAMNESFVCPDSERDKLGDSINQLLDWYGKADSLAMHFQTNIQGNFRGVSTDFLFERNLKLKRDVFIKEINLLRKRLVPIQNIHFGRLRTLFLLVFLAVTSFELYAHLFKPFPWVLMAYPLILVLAYSRYYDAKRKNWENKYLDYRALAEGFRVQYFWRVAGLPDSVADKYLTTHQSEMDWIRIALQSSNVVIENKSTEMAARESLLFVKEHWVQDQLDFFKKKMSANKQLEKRCEFLVNLFFILSSLLAVTLAAIHSYHLYIVHKELQELIIHGLITALAMTLVSAALIHGYSEKKAFSVQSKRYEWMANLFQRFFSGLTLILSQEHIHKNLEYVATSSEKLEKDEKRAQELLRILGEEALIESGGWLLLHRERPLDLPKV